MTDPDKRLFCAVDTRDADAVEQALEEGADPNVREDYNDTPLHNFYRMNSHSKPCERLLLERGADPDALNEKGLTPKETCGDEI